MKILNRIIYLSFILLFCLINSNVSLSFRQTQRASSFRGMVNNSASSGLNTTLYCDKPGDPRCLGTATEAFISCGNNAQKNTSGTACECIDPENYVINAKTPNECIEKTNSFAIAQRKSCGNALIKAIEKECDESYFNNGIGTSGIKCYDPNDLFLMFDTSSIKVYIEGMPYDYDKVCYNYTEDLTKSIAEDYSISGINSPNCRLKRVIADASNDCFREVLSTGKAKGATESIRLKLNNLCGVAGLNKKWTELFGQTDTLGVIFPTDIPDLYVKAGKLSSADGLELVGNILDGKITDKSNTWERDLTQILNSHLAEVSGACGQEYKIATHDTDIQIQDERSSLQRSIDEQGLIKGSTTWGLNQASVIVGENQTNKLTREGIIGGKKDEEVISEVISSIELEGFDSDYISQKSDEMKYSGQYLLTTTDEYRLIEVLKDGDNITYSTINYTDELNLPSSILKEMIGKDESEFTIQNEKITID